MPKPSRRYDGNPSGHISMDNRTLMATKDLIKRELDYQYQLRASGRDQPQKDFTRASSEVFPTPRPSPPTSRYKQRQPQEEVGAMGDSSSSSVISRLQTAATASPVVFDQQPINTARAHQNAAASKEDYMQLVQRRAAIERQLAELDEVIAFKTTKETRARQHPRAERPFAQFLETHRAHADVAPVTKTVTGSWDR